MSNGGRMPDQWYFDAARLLAAGMTLKSVGERIGVSTERVRQMSAQAARRLGIWDVFKAEHKAGRFRCAITRAEWWKAVFDAYDTPDSGERCMTPEEQGCYDALRADYDALAARLAEVERLLQEVYDGRQSLMSVGLVYRIGHTLNHRPADSATHRENDDA